MPNNAPIMQNMAAEISTIFSSAVYKDLSSTQPNFAIDRIRYALRGLRLSASTTLGDALDLGYGILMREYRSEYVFKNELVSKIVFGRHKPTTASAALELRLGHSLADVAIFNGTSTVYEIKTDLDSFQRLETQVRDYQRRVEFVYVVVSEKRVQVTARRLPEGVGLVALRRQGTLRPIIAAQSNLPKIRSSDIFPMLRQVEAEQILDRAGVYLAQGDPVERWHVSRRSFGELSTDVAHRGAVRALRDRGAHVRRMMTDPFLPRSARALAYSTDLSTTAARRLRELLHQPLYS